ncbi:recombination and repair protein [Escherichia virus KFS-EC]|uniref:Recombination and repair protein n=1 Tax=Escherichia virus KFS-EC TaxID=2250214 RepID=A0A345BSB0_9CAUD|nr:DNA repair protein [Escherichia virus KFS-EC]AXF53331.1 recombination and repair protein [Escherichia virus KFS-EC]
MSVLEKLKKNSTLKTTAVLSKSSFFNEKTNTRTKNPMLNIAFSGDLKKGFQSGLIFFAGPSKHFKSNMGLTCVSAYMKQNPDAACLFFDSEFGITSAYLSSMGVDPDRVVHVPIKNIEELKFEIMNQLEQITREDKVIIFIDSIGNLASKKEVEDAINEKSAQDMTRAKALKGLFRMITPYLTMNDIPCIAINHVYSSMDLYPKDIMGGGTGGVYSSNEIFIIGRRQQKEGTEVTGYDFILKAEKSRTVREGSKFPISVTFSGGIDPYSGLLDLAVELGWVVKPSNGWYSRAILNEETGEMEVEDRKVRAKDTDSVEFWKPLLTNEHFQKAINDHYQLGQIISDEAVDKEIEDMLA